MAAHRKFTFDNPEDSYWNSNDPIAVSFADDNLSTTNAAAARAALEDLFECKVRFDSEDGSSNAESESPLTAENSTKQNLSFRNGSVNMLKTITASSISNRPFLHLDEDHSFDEKFSFKSAAIFSKSSASVISDGSGESLSSNVTAQLDYSRLKSEHRKLQKHLEQVRLERYRAADPEITVRRLLRNDPVSLDLYRSKKEKLDLLEAALESYDGNVIIAVVLSLERSLETSVFLDIIKEKPIAVNHYIAYLKDMKNFDQLTSTLLALNRTEEVALVLYSVACRKQPSERIVYLKKCLNSCSAVSSLVAFSKSVNEYIDLLERQIIIEDADEALIKEEGSKIFQQYPKTVTLIGRPVLTTLYYSCLYHFDLPVNAYASPLSIKEFFNITEKQYAWTTISALTRLKRWNDIEKVLMSKKLLGGVKIHCPFGWRHLFTIISSNEQPPKEILCKFLRAIPDLNERQRLANQFPEVSEVTIECLVAQKDRIALSAFLAKLTPHTVEAHKALNALNNATNRWKN
uniref:Vps16 C-terminal domain-containing protein n=1 Tax=Onchocerca volvulus TaxID=6282 RepID=A0A8R1Y225_ONCVO